jgi:hypothetical protein
MKIHFFFGVLSLMLISSCQQKKSMNSKLGDEKIIPKAQVISIFEELVLIESHLQSKYYSYSNYSESLQLSRDSLFKVKGVTLHQFSNSFDYYSKTDQELVTMYQEVLNNYNEKSAQSVIRSR